MSLLMPDTGTLNSMLSSISGGQSSPANTEMTDSCRIIIAVVVPVALLSIKVLLAYIYKKRISTTMKTCKDSQMRNRDLNVGSDRVRVLLYKQPTVRSDELHYDHI